MILHSTQQTTADSVSKLRFQVPISVVAGLHSQQPSRLALLHQ
jgi:hypothetical protein